KNLVAAGHRPALRSRGINSSSVTSAACVLFLFAALDFTLAAAPREHISINDNWRFTKGDPDENSARLIYDVRPEVKDKNDAKAADTEPTAAEEITVTNRAVLKPWILPTANPFIKEAAK